ncbi:Zn-dependent protease with chaperone function [Roseateles sp. YR242]|uniref:M48 family metallopeptidase n=1 Tax=Roseateles sp. YR242 TaxID=1855305 RepID=UPI0008CB1F25|nr:M48 family metallopeptidase [Roseateles sp. YR242]SEK68399.1 Zn-dependent protease with chaperone function [Roseateles sp. YR242]
MSDVYSTNARWFDGRDNRPRMALVRIHGEHLELVPHFGDDSSGPLPSSSGSNAEAARRGPASRYPAVPVEGTARQYARALLQVGERWRDTPVSVLLPDGGSVMLSPDSAVAKALAPRSLATRLIGCWPGVLLSLVLLIALVTWFDRQGAGLLASAALPLVPETVDIAVGDAAQTRITRRWLENSELPQARRKQLEARFDAMAERRFPGVYAELHFGRAQIEMSDGTRDDSGGYNAFALPNGTIFLLDGMANELSDDELMAVLAHEIAHVKYRHVMRGMVSGIGLVAVARVVLGDYSGIAAQAVGTVQALHYGRDAEREADAQAQRVIREEGLPPDTLTKVWRKLQAKGGDGDGALPALLSTHPSLQERIESAERAMAAPR